MAIDEAWAMLATRIPKALHRELRLHCVKSDVTIMSFVTAAVAEKIKRDSARPRRSTLATPHRGERTTLRPQAGGTPQRSLYR
jgi:hypothetical protein